MFSMNAIQIAVKYHSLSVLNRWTESGDLPTAQLAQCSKPYQIRF